MYTRGVLIVLCVYCVIHLSGASQELDTRSDRMSTTAGGLGEEKRGDDDTQKIANEVGVNGNCLSFQGWNGRWGHSPAHT